MCLIDILVGHLISVGAVGGRLLYHGKLRQESKFLQHFHHIGIWELVVVEQFAQVIDGWRYRVNEVLLVLEISAEPVCAKHLKRTEKHE